VEPIVNPGAALAVAGKFAYGVISKDLEDEDVTLFVRLPGADPCGAWREVGTATTDSDGRATVAVDPALVPEPGHYDFRLVVLGDQTDARGALWVVEPGTAFVLFDVDGTLTIGDAELFEQILLGQNPEMYTSADTVAQTWFDAGYQPLYVTGRPYFLNPATRTWLAQRGFPQGPVRTTDDLQQALPTADGVQTYKREYLRGLMADAGIVIPAAYGNATTDICAYAQAGLDPASTWIIGPNAGGACEGFAATQALADYPSHLPALADLPPAP
jgi:phosphatidate phosphatase PAH1